MKPDSVHLAAGDGDEDFRQGRASSDAATSAMTGISPTFFVRHPDGSHSIAQPQPTAEQIAAQADFKYTLCDHKHGGGCCSDPDCYCVSGARMLTNDEVSDSYDVRWEDYEPYPKWMDRMHAVIRKFCEVNGITLRQVAQPVSTDSATGSPLREGTRPDAKDGAA